MYYLIIFSYVLQALSYTKAVQLNLENDMKIETDFISFLNKEYDPRDDSLEDETLYKNKFNPKFQGSKDLVANSSTLDKTDEFKAYIEHIKDKGVTILKKIGKLIINEMHVEEDAEESIETVCNVYATTIQNYHIFISQQAAKFIAREDFLFLDVSEVASRLIYQLLKKMLDEAVPEISLTDTNTAPDISDQSIENLTKIFQNESLNMRVNEAQYLCEKYKICRPYPAFSDYFGHFIKELMSLSESKQYMFCHLFRMSLKSNKHFAEFMEYVAVNSFSNAMETFFVDDFDLHHSYLVEMYSAASEKFHLIRSSKTKKQMTGPAIRILFDLFDERFNCMYETFIDTFDYTVKAIKNWGEDKITSIVIVLSNFIKELCRIIDDIIKSDKNVLKKIINMIKMIFDEEPEYDEMYDNTL
ncbi:uncharacterized protein LOC142982264 [Anticarsia gemmatalis]|uniref:uncharacterized protein LOC142982264 n=1 Tax=Anticarsia gemmatalis TaxID=129554 RepID=UPI003F76E82E